jgi:hypothetical protein
VGVGSTFTGGANSLLVGSARDGYLAFDYLIDLPGVATMPDASWSALVEHATGDEANMLAEHAILDGSYTQGVRALLRAAEAGVSRAAADLGDLGIQVHPASESLERALEDLLFISAQPESYSRLFLRVIDPNRCGSKRFEYKEARRESNRLTGSDWAVCPPWSYNRQCVT